jgi:hypothetical protein
VIQRAGNPIPGGLKSIDGFVHSISEDASVVKSRIKMMKVSLAAINKKKAEPVESKE